MRIGISVITHRDQNIWQNGMGQNVMFFVSLLQCLPFVKSLVLIDVGDQGAMPPQVDLDSHNVRLVTQSAATELVDVVIEMGGALDTSWLDLMRARGKKVVYYCCGHPFAALAESAIFDKPGHFSRADRCDEIWVLPEYRTFAVFQRVLHRCPVHVVPYLWHPRFVEKRIAEVDACGYRFGWQPAAAESRGLRVAIFEPNISVAKTSSISMLICDEAYRADSESIKALHVLNTLHMTDHSTLLYFANSLELVKQHKTTFHGRHDVVGFMAQHADAVVSHQWTNEQNYNYLDVLYGDYPLVHNSPWLREFDAGYFYPGFEAMHGSAQLRLAAKKHGRRITGYRNASKRVFKAVDPSSPHNCDEYAKRLLLLYGDGACLDGAEREA